MISTIIFMLAVASVYLVSGVQFIPQMISIMTMCLLALAAFVLLALGRKPLARDLGIQALAFGALAVLLYGGIKLDNSLARRGAVRLAAACEEYKAKTGAYPETVRELVPGYLAKMPRARHTIMWGQYAVVGDKVMFLLEPGLLAHSYEISSGAWKVVDAARMFPAKP